jgi:hypothetical protein
MKERFPTVELCTIERQEIAIRSACKVDAPVWVRAGSGARISLLKPCPRALDHR